MLSRLNSRPRIANYAPLVHFAHGLSPIDGPPNKQYQALQAACVHHRTEAFVEHYAQRAGVEVLKQYSKTRHYYRRLTWVGMPHRLIFGYYGEPRRDDLTFSHGISQLYCSWWYILSYSLGVYRVDFIHTASHSSLLTLWTGLICGKLCEHQSRQMH
jgi:hypothetical protein